MIKTTIITSQFIILLSITVFSQKDTTVCFDFNPDYNQKLRKNIISIDALKGGNIDVNFGISYERILKENTTIKASFGGLIYDYYSESFKSYHFKLAYHLYFSNVKYAKTKVNNDTYLIRKQQKTMLIPKGLYAGAFTHFGVNNRSLNYIDYDLHNIKDYGLGIGVSIGYQFIIGNRIAFNISLPLTIGYYNHVSYDIAGEEINKGDSFRPESLLNFNLGIAF